MPWRGIIAWMVELEGRKGEVVERKKYFSKREEVISREGFRVSSFHNFENKNIIRQLYKTTLRLGSVISKIPR